MNGLARISLMLLATMAYLGAPAIRAQTAGTFVLGDAPYWLGTHCVGGPNAGAACAIHPDDQPGQAAEFPERDCTWPSDPPPADWRSRVSGTTQFADAIEGEVVAIPRNSDGTCAHASLIGVLSPGGTADSFATKKIDYKIAEDGANCTLTVLKGKVKQRVFPRTTSQFARRPGGARLPDGISAVKWYVRVRMSLRDYNPYPSVLEFGASNAFKYWDFGSGGLGVVNPPWYADRFYWSYLEGWFPDWYNTWWENVVPPSTGGGSMAALSQAAFSSIYGETGYVYAYEQAWGDGGYVAFCSPSWVNTSAINQAWRCRAWQLLKGYY